jgi:hypothetical protein
VRHHSAGSVATSPSSKEYSRHHSTGAIPPSPLRSSSIPPSPLRSSPANVPAHNTPIPPSSSSSPFLHAAVVGAASAAGVGVGGGGGPGSPRRSQHNKGNKTEASFLLVVRCSFIGRTLLVLEDAFGWCSRRTLVGARG